MTPALQRTQQRVPLAPFLAYCEQREAQIRRELDEYPAITAGRSGGAPTAPQHSNVGARLVMDLGWDVEGGQRRLHRWRHESGADARGDRALIEDALEHAGEDFCEWYPDEPRVEAWPYSGRMGRQRYMTDAQIIAAHTVYMRGQMTAQQLADMIWQRYGYKDARGCARALQAAWVRMALPARPCAATRNGGGRCRKSPARNSGYCLQHDETLKPRHAWAPPPELLAEARAMHEQGTSFRAIGFALVDRCEWKHPTYVGVRLGEIAKAQGWYYAGRVAA